MDNISEEERLRKVVELLAEAVVARIKRQQGPSPTISMGLEAEIPEAFKASVLCDSWERSGF